MRHLQWPKSVLPLNAYSQRVEDKAISVLGLCLDRLGIAEVPLPIPVDIWIESPLGIGFGISNLAEQLKVPALGAAFTKEKEILIDESVVKNEGRYRFTCAHELGHIMLHSNVKRVFHDQYIGEAEQVDKFERQADRFAAAFLMPIPLLVSEFFAAVKTHAPGAKQAIETAVMPTPQSEELWRELIIPRLESRFAVSRRALLTRLADVKLADSVSLLPQEISERIAADLVLQSSFGNKPQGRFHTR